MSHVMPAPIEVEAETSQNQLEWQEATYLLLGAVLNKLGKQGVVLKQSELSDFASKHKVTFQPLADGALKYTVSKIK